MDGRVTESGDEALGLSYHGYRFPPETISHAVWLYTNGVFTCGSPGLGKNRDQESDRQQATHHRFRAA